MVDIRSRYRAALSRALVACQQATNVPVAVCEIQRGELVFPLLPPRASIHFPKDRLHILNLAALGDQPDAAASPIYVDGEVRAILLFEKSSRHKDADLCLSDIRRVVIAFIQAMYSTADSEQKESEECETTITKLRLSVRLLTHEVQNGLQAFISDTSKLLADAKSLDTAQVAARIHQLRQNLLLLSTVTYTLGDWQHLEEYKFEEIPVASLVAEAKRLYEAMAETRYITIYDKLESPLHKIYGSRLHLQLALNNLLHNAIKYSFEGNWREWRTVRIVGHPDDGMYVLTIENYGVGILPEEISSRAIFQEGYQGKLTQGEYRPGAGKGLAFVASVIEKHGGHILVESAPMASSRLRGKRPTTDENVDKSRGRPYLNRFHVHLPALPGKEIDERNGDEKDGAKG